MSPSRTRALSSALAALVVVSVILATPGIAVAVALTPVGPTSAANGQHPGGSTTPQTARAPVIEEAQTFERGDEHGTVRLQLAYDIPAGVTAFRVRLPDLAGSSVSVVEREGFARQSETAFEWTRSTSTPTLVLQLRVATDEVSTDDWGVMRDDWAFATVPPMGVDITYTGTQPRLTATTRVDGPGYATDRMAFMGTYDRVDVTNDEETVRFIVGNGTVEANVSSASRFLERARGRFDFGVRRDRLVVFVLPFEGRTLETDGATVTGEAFGDAFWVTADATTVSGPENAFAHEYVHSRLTEVGNGSSAWLTEATAEYYGSLTTLNVGGTSYEQFYRTTRAEEFGPNGTATTLSDPETWRGTLGNYEKGAHVLAALDATIRERTAGNETLYDVFVANQSFDDYAAFREAVVETAGDESLGPWLDRYVTTDALPPLPDDPARYVHGPGLDPDGDGLTSREELSFANATNPFVADTDGDTLSDAREREALTDPTRTDTDGDGTNDALDAYPTDPAVQRTDTNEDVADETSVEPNSSVTATAGATRGGDTGTSANADGEQGERAEGNAGETRTETPGFGVGVTLVGFGIAGRTLVGMRGRRENRASS